MSRLASQSENFPQWYLDVIEQAGLAENSDVKGCIVFKPYGYAIWENVQRELDRRIKELDVENAYFPLFIPESIINKEKEHIKGFAPECAVVTIGGGKELAEKLYVRPTSETIIYTTFAKWVQSYRDLPLRINQWANVVRWEMRTRPFLRTTEFLWQEGHTAHATEEEAEEMVRAALQMYVDFDRDCLAIPVMHGYKPDHERFAGAEYTLTTEALARDGKAIQAGTSHNLGQGFSEAYDIGFLDESGERKRPWITSWGLSTRIIGTIIVVHGDEQGLRLPPNVAPIQVVIIPIYKSQTEKELITTLCRELAEALKGHVRVKVDLRDEKSPGFKFNEWEVKGVPLRIEIGPKDYSAGTVTVVRRDTGIKETTSRATCTPDFLLGLLADIQGTLLEEAKQHLASHTYEARSLEELHNFLESGGGFVWAPWDGSTDSANRVKEATKATIRLIEKGQDLHEAKDLLSGASAKYRALYARAY